MKRENFNDPYNGCRGCYHFSSSHQETRLLFRSRRDFIFGVNTLALLLPGSDVQIVAYCLMDNHIHILLIGKYGKCLKYYDRVVHRIAMMIGKEYGVSGVLKVEEVEIVPIMNDPQLKDEICYIHRNPYKARIASPVCYPWSSADVYFPFQKPEGKRISEMSISSVKKLFRTHGNIPDWYEHHDGKITNSSFVSSNKAMEKFISSVEYFDILRRYSLESEVEESHGIHENVTFSDAELQERIKHVCVNEFHVDSHRSLARKDLLRLARVVSARYGARPAQLARLIGVDKETLKRIL